MVFLGYIFIDVSQYNKKKLSEILKLINISIIIMLFVTEVIIIINIISIFCFR
jgi:hypothetical protein